ncbi:MAG TPA: flagellar hook protein FlgE [Acidimicrobiales bacterium]|nr:flagellar hook protein FlgE [Acidimicrobiales bacterium]
MEQSLISAVSGIEANQTYLDVVGNNVANANTVGYKAESANFTDLLAEQIAGAAAPLPNNQGAGVNPIAIGTGVRIGAVSNNQSQGALLQTNQPTDVAIQGSGFLVAVQNGQTEYTRAGNLIVDANGNLATAGGGLIQGWTASAQGVISTNAPTGPVAINQGMTMPALATQKLTLGGNLPAWSGNPASQPNPVTVTQNTYDALGNAIPVTFTFTPVTGKANQWTMQGSVPDPANPGSAENLFSGSGVNVAFDSSTGQLTSLNGTAVSGPGPYTLTPTMPAGYTFPSGDTWSIQFPGINGSGSLTQYVAPSSLTAQTDGYASGSLASFAIGPDGVITGSFTNGKSLALGQMALATFSNPGGLADQGGLMYRSTANSGAPNVGTPGTGGRGTLVGGSLEGSNVDLATQLTDLIVAQEAYQANTKVVSTTATNLQALTQMA